jgi:hypothetical protein
MIKHCKGCNAFIEPCKDRFICRTFNGYSSFSRILILSKKFSINFCPCKTCLVKSICTNEKRAKIEVITKDVRRPFDKNNLSGMCELFYEQLRNFAISEIAAPMGGFLDKYLFDDKQKAVKKAIENVK